MESNKDFSQKLKLIDGTMIVAGSMIGSGIFIVSADIVRNVGSAGWLLLVWVLTGIMTLFAAISYGELSGMFPKAGGQYVYLKEAYNDLIGFLYGWSFFSVIQTATIAAVAVAFAKFTAYLVPYFAEDNILLDLGLFTVSAAQLLAVFLIILLTASNTRGIEQGRLIQNVFTFTKIGSMIGLLLFGFFHFSPEVWAANWENAFSLHSFGGTPYETTTLALGAIAAAMVGSIFSSDQWNNVTFVAGEIVNPKRNIGLSLFLGTLMVTLLYLLINIMYVSVLSLDEIAHAQNDRVGVAASLAIFGQAGTVIIALMLMVSTFGCNNGVILSGPRVYYTMAKDGLFFDIASKLNNFSVPANALWIQCALACAWAFSGKYGDLLDMISFVVVLFYVLTIVGIFKLRRSQPDLARPYKAWGYPVVPILYILMGVAFCSLLIVYKPKFTWPGLLITLAGIPIYYYLHNRNRGEKRRDGV